MPKGGALGAYQILSELGVGKTISVTDTPVQLLAENPRRLSMEIENDGAAGDILYVAADPDVTTSSWSLPGASGRDFAGVTSAVWAVAAAGKTITVRVLETTRSFP